MAKFDIKMTLEQVLADADLKAVIQKYMPDVDTNPMVGMVKGKTLAEIKDMIPMPDMKEKVAAVLEELHNLK